MGPSPGKMVPAWARHQDKWCQHGPVTRTNGASMGPSPGQMVPARVRHQDKWCQHGPVTRRNSASTGPSQGQMVPAQARHQDIWCQHGPVTRINGASTGPLLGHMVPAQARHQDVWCLDRPGARTRAAHKHRPVTRTRAGTGPSPEHVPQEARHDDTCQNWHVTWTWSVHQERRNCTNNDRTATRTTELHQ